MNSFEEKVKETRIAKGMTQQELALVNNVTQATWSKYESGDIPFPEDVAINTIMYLKDAKLREYYSYYKKTSVLNLPPLNNVDDNNLTVISCLIEEAGELIAAAEKLRKVIKNKTSADDLTDAEWEKIWWCEEQIADILPAVNLHFVRMNQVFNFDIGRLELKMKMKLKDRKYIK